jgi:hypothetical protein
LVGLFCLSFKVKATPHAPFAATMRVSNGISAR